MAAAWRRLSVAASCAANALRFASSRAQSPANDMLQVAAVGAFRWRQTSAGDADVVAAKVVA